MTRTANLSGAPPGVRACQSADDLVGLAPLDLVLVPGMTEPIPAFLADRFLPAPPAPGAITWRRSRHRFWDER